MLLQIPLEVTTFPYCVRNDNLWNEGAITQPHLISLSAVEVRFLGVMPAHLSAAAGGGSGNRFWGRFGGARCFRTHTCERKAEEPGWPKRKLRQQEAMKYIFHTRALWVGPSRLNNLCCLVVRGYLSPGGSALGWGRFLQPSSTLREVTVEAACRPSFVSSKVTPEKGWSTPTFSTLYRSENEGFIQLMCLFLSKNSRHPAPH